MITITSASTLSKANSLKFNKEYFFDFVQLLSEQKDKGKLNEGSINTYINKAINILEFFDKVEMGMEQVSIEDIRAYADLDSKDIDSVFKNVLKRIFRVVRSRTNTLVTEKEIDGLEGKKKPRIESSPLSIDEVIEIRNRLSRDGEYKLLFTFEMFYTYNLSLDEIVRFGSDTYSETEHTFTVSTNRVIKMSKVIYELIADHPDLLERKKRGSFSSYRKDVGDFIKLENNNRKKFTLYDLQLTREKFFPTCPLCKEKYPNTDEFWVLVEYEYDDYRRKWFYCRDCASKMAHGDQQ